MALAEHSRPGSTGCPPQTLHHRGAASLSRPPSGDEDDESHLDHNNNGTNGAVSGLESQLPSVIPAASLLRRGKISDVYDSTTNHDCLGDDEDDQYQVPFDPVAAAMAMENITPVVEDLDDPNRQVQLPQQQWRSRQKRPQVRYVTMIRQALLDAKPRPLTVAEIYQYIMDKYPYYRDDNHLHWKNTVRHNLANYDQKLFKSIRYVRGEEGKDLVPRNPIAWTLMPDWVEVEGRMASRTVVSALEQQQWEHSTGAADVPVAEMLARIKSSSDNVVKRNPSVRKVMKNVKPRRGKKYPERCVPFF